MGHYFLDTQYIIGSDPADTGAYGLIQSNPA